MTKVTYSDRGFAQYGAVVDTYGTEARVAESSTVDEPCVWVFIKEPNSKLNGPALHLTEEQTIDLCRKLKAAFKNHYHNYNLPARPLEIED